MAKAKKAAKPVVEEKISVTEAINFLRAYLSDLSAIRNNLMASIAQDETGSPIMVPSNALEAVDQEIIQAVRALAALRQKLVPNAPDASWQIQLGQAN